MIIAGTIILANGLIDELNKEKTIKQVQDKFDTPIFEIQSINRENEMRLKE